MEWYRTYRPTEFNQVKGQDEAVASLQAILHKDKKQRVYLFQGPSGSGKTTLARIFARELGCVDGDLHEIDCALAESPIDSIRQIQARMTLSPGFGGCQVWLLEEAQALARAQFAQQALLKVLEECPSRVYFMLTTTDPSKLIAAVRSRCTKIPIKALRSQDLDGILCGVLEAEGVGGFQEEEWDKIIESSQGNARSALLLLEKLAQVEGEEEREACISSENASEKDAFKIVKALLWEKCTWKKLAGIISDLGEQDWEGLRRLVLKVAGNEMLKAGKNTHRAYLVLDSFKDPWYDSNRAGLLASCYEALSAK